MNLGEILQKIEAGELDVHSAMELLNLRKTQTHFSCIDHSRESRCGFPEFVFGEGKSLEQLLSISAEIADSGKPLLITRIPALYAEKILERYPDADFSEDGKVLLYLPPGFSAEKGNVLILTAGTTDMPVALEARYTLAACGCRSEIAADSGVAGIHRVMNHIDRLNQADVVIVVAGMEGALPSVIGGLVSVPVIAVPTSIGYGTSLGGLTAMFSMLNSCASGVTVMNIDNGFGAACAAARIINSK